MENEVSSFSDEFIGDLCNGDHKEPISPNLLGLDYHFHVYNKMYVKDILNLTEYPHCKGFFAYKDHPILKVDVIGVVVKKDENSKCFLYAVDDGTGVILSCCWKVNFYKQNAPDNQSLNIPNVLRSKVTEIDSNNATEGYDLGDLIQVKGKIKIFREKKEIVVSNHKKILDPQIHVLRLCELPKLYTLRYDRPFVLPYKLQRVIEKQNNVSTCCLNEGALVDELKKEIFVYISQNQNVTLLPINILRQNDMVKNIFMKYNKDKRYGLEKENSLLMEALSLIENDGHITRRSDQRLLFESLLYKSEMEKQISFILEREMEKPSSTVADRGCHYLCILDELHKTINYSKVKKESLMFCLKKMEEESIVIRSTQSHYLPFYL